MSLFILNSFLRAFFRFNIAAGKVTYQCRFLKSDVYKKNWEAKRIVVTEFGTKAMPDPCHSIFDRSVYGPFTIVSIILVLRI